MSATFAKLLSEHPTFDPHCLDLAALFLSDCAAVTDEHRVRLASHIQGEIEAWLDAEGLEEKPAPVRDEPRDQGEDDGPLTMAQQADVDARDGWRMR